jgi:hypothetical protein
MAAEDAAAAADGADFQFDPVKVEIERWSYLSPETIEPYITSDGMVNHFKLMWDLRKLMWDLRKRFPLHFIVFKQVSSHIAHEANVEQYFSRAVVRSGSKTVAGSWLARGSLVEDSSQRARGSLVARGSLLARLLSHTACSALAHPLACCSP